MDLEEVISYYAKRGDMEMLHVLRQIQEDMEQQEDPDYEPDTEESESEVSIDTDTEESEVELDEDGCVPETFNLIPSMKGGLYLLYE